MCLPYDDLFWSVATKKDHRKASTSRPYLEAFPMKKVILLVFCICSTFGFGLDRGVARQLEQLMNNAVGVVSTFPEEVRTRRSGGVEQKIEISDDGVLTLSFSFLCYPAPEEGKKAKLARAVTRKSFVLGQLKANSTKRYEVNLHLNTISFYDHGLAWVIAFRSKVDLERASKLLFQLITSADETMPQKVDAAKMAKDAGFRYVVFAPRAPSVEDEIRLLRGPELSSNVIAWLTKNEPSLTSELLAESYNAFPLFFYDLSVLNESPFYTVSFPGMTTFFPCTIAKEYEQSVFSDDEAGLKNFFHDSPYVGIRFQNMPSYIPCEAILCLESEKKMNQQAKARGIDKDVEIAQQTPAYFDPQIPEGPFSVWFTGLNENSDDIFRYLIWTKKITRENLSKVLYREFPALSTLLKTKSRYRKDLSLEDCLTMRMSSLYSIWSGLSSFSKKVLMVACYAQDLGTPFGPDEDLYCNSWPLALCVAEKLGLQENEKVAVRLLLHDQPLPGGKPDKKENGFSIFLQEAKEAADLGLSLGEWMSLKMCFDLVLSNQFRAAPGNITVPMNKLNHAAKNYSNLLPFGIPFGTSVFKGTFPTHDIVSAYIWEVLDQKHREGIALKRCRERYEKLMIEKPKSKLYPQAYLNSDEERAEYRAVFENGHLASPSYPADQEVELLFVVDRWGRLYIAPQKIAKSKEEVGFSHASFFAGSPIAAAGKLVIRNQQIVLINDHSSRYPSGPDEMKILLEVLQKADVPIEEIKVDTRDQTGHGKSWEAAQKFLSEMQKDIQNITSQSTDAE
jgi:hypothetical protein